MTTRWVMARGGSEATFPGANLDSEVHMAINIVSKGADPTGNQDSSMIIQHVIDGNGGGAIFFPRGIYKLESMLILRSGTHLLGDSDATIKAAFSLQSGMVWTDQALPTRNISVRGLVFDQSD